MLVSLSLSLSHTHTHTHTHTHIYTIYREDSSIWIGLLCDLKILLDPRFNYDNLVKIYLQLHIKCLKYKILSY